MKRVLSITRVFATSFMLVGAASFVAVVSAPDIAIAKNGNGGGNSGGNSGGKGDGGGKGNSGGKGSDGGKGNGAGKSKGKSGEHGAKGKNGAGKASVGTGKGLLGKLGIKKTDRQKAAKSRSTNQKKPAFVTSLENLVKGNKKQAKPVTRAKRKAVVAIDEEAVHPNKHGKIASELKALNAAHASQTALRNAAPNSMPGKLYSYQQSVLNYPDASEDLEDKQTELSDLQGLTDEQIQEQYAPTEEEAAEGITAEDKYNDAVTDAEQAVQDAEDTLADATEPQEALDSLTGGRELSPDAMGELHDLLGLPEPEEFDDTSAEAEAEAEATGEEEVVDG